MDSGCSRHMTGNVKWFSNLTPARDREYVTFGDDKRGRITGRGMIKVNEKFVLKDVALVKHLRYNLLSVSQLLDDGLEVSFKPRVCRILDSTGALVCGISRIGKVFRADFSIAQSSHVCLLIRLSSDLWLWHRRLGHMSFDLLCRLSGLGLIRGLPELKFEKNLVCAPCHHGKMVAASHAPVNLVMTERPCELLHMDTVGPSRVRSVGGKWYVLVIVEDFSRYSWVFFLASKDEVFMHFWSLALRLFKE